MKTTNDSHDNDENNVLYHNEHNFHEENKSNA